jgi:hypothetical protein
MSTSQGKPAGQGYSIGFSKASESADHKAPSGGRSFGENEKVMPSIGESSPASDRTAADTNHKHVAGSDGVAAVSRVSRTPVVRLPYAAQLPFVEGLPRVVTQGSPPDAMSFASEIGARTPTLRRPHRSLSGAKMMLLFITMIAAPLAFAFFAFDSSPLGDDAVSAWVASLFDGKAGVSRPTAPPSPIGRQDIVPAAQLPLEAKNRTTESGTPEDGSGTVPGMSPDGESQRDRAAQESSTPKIDAAAASTAPLADALGTVPGPLPLAPPPRIEARGTIAQTEPRPERQAPSIRTPTQPDGISAMVTAKATPSQSAADVERMMTNSGTVDQRAAVAPDLSLRSETPRRRENQVGAWTYCTVNLIPGGQIAVQKATTYQACISAGKKCAGNRRYADIQFFDRPTLTSKFPLEMCNTES